MYNFKIYTLGCKVNQYDTQVIREQFLRAGFKERQGNENADIYVINTCTVTSRADRESRYLISRAYRRNPQAKVVVTGCYTECDAQEISGLPGVSLIVRNKDKYRLLALIDAPNKNNELSENNEPSDSGITHFSNHTRAFLKVQDGCNNFCSYCKVPLVRGRSRSRKIKDIVKEAGHLTENGFKEIVLTGICLGAFGKDLSPAVNLSDVIKALGQIDGLMRMRLSSIEMQDVSGELIRHMASSEKLCRHLHIPLQSGDGQILKRMNRRYNAQDFLNLIRKIKKSIPDIAITTDALVGFPGETDTNFQNTVRLIKNILPLKVHIFPYSPRKGTVAFACASKVSDSVIRKRITALKSVADWCAVEYKEKFLGREMDVLIEGPPRQLGFKERLKQNWCGGKNRMGFWEGHTNNYIKVVVGSKRNLKNEIIPLKLKEINNGSVLADFN